MADVLKPDLVWIEGRCYRLNDSTTEVTAFQEHDLYENEVSLQDLEVKSDDEIEEFEINKVDDSRYSTNFHVSKHYLGSIIGKKGATKSRIEHDTKTQIKIPRQGQSGDVVIFGTSASNVKAARRRINIIVMSSRMKQKSTHFVSIPMNKEDIIKKFTNFKESVLKKCTSRGIEESLFIQPTKLHLTLGMMCLMDNEERLIGAKLLSEAKDKIVMPMLEGCLPLRLRMKGLSYMNDDPEQIDVLYGCVQEDSCPSGLLQNLADALVHYFYKAGYMEKEHDRDNVKLHVTLMNSKYRKRSSPDNDDESKRARGVRLTFDGKEVLEKFGDYDFGVAVVNEIHLSSRHSMGNDGYYLPTCVINCNK